MSRTHNLSSQRNPMTLEFFQSSDQNSNREKSDGFGILIGKNNWLWIMIYIFTKYEECFIEFRCFDRRKITALECFRMLQIRIPIGKTAEFDLWLTFFKKYEECFIEFLRMPLSYFSDRRKLMTSEFFKTSEQNSDRQNNWLRIMTHLFHKMWRMLHRILRNTWSNDLVPLILAMEPLEHTLPIWLSFLHTVYLKIKIHQSNHLKLTNSFKVGIM